MTTRMTHQQCLNSGHFSATVKNIRTMEGNLELTICNSCAYIITLCEHEQCEWTEDATVLRCQLCGVDAT